jgi:hypothetical protein
MQTTADQTVCGFVLHGCGTIRGGANVQNNKDRRGKVEVPRQQTATLQR